MKIYTKKGDKGLTGLIGGTRVPKHSLRIDAYGTVDELNSHLGILRDRAISDFYKEEIIFVQDRLFTLGSLLAADPEKSTMELPQVHESDIEKLEKSIDKMDTELPPMKFFVLPGGHETVSFCHVARCVCRRAERLVCELDEKFPQNPIILAFLNRLSDYLFVYGRYVSMKLNAEEIAWKPKM